jgi:adenylate cyclase
VRGGAEGQRWFDGAFAQRARLASGLVLLAFALTHFLNHGLGLVSLDTMLAVQEVRRAVWRSPPGTVLLYGAFIVHIGFALGKLIGRRTLRLPPWEALQLVLGLLIPYQLMIHIIATRGANLQFGIDDTYIHELAILWPVDAVPQSALLLLVWVHAMIGLHYWLRIRRWYARAFLPLFAVAVLVPTLALAGWIAAARQVVDSFDVAGFTREQVIVLLGQVEVGTTALTVIGALLAAAIFVPRMIDRARARVTVTYPGDRVFRVRPGPSLLEISRMLGVPHASVCGGRARCSTCRVAVIAGAEELAPADPRETAVLARINADARTRLACQIRPSADISVQPLVPAREAATGAADAKDAYHWGVERAVAVLFADIRNFTGLAEERLPFDVVFILNRYVALMSQRIESQGGYVDKFIGDGVMAIFGMSEDLRSASRNAMAAAAEMGEALEQLNSDLSSSLEAPLRIGIGIHAGPAILGRIGTTGIGAVQGITALGDTVNTASRLETATKEYGALLVVSDGLVRAAGAKLTGGDHQIKVKGREKPLKIWAIGDAAAVRAALAGQGEPNAPTEPTEPTEPVPAA